MRCGITFSSILHLVILLLVYFGVPFLFSDDDMIEQLIPVTVYPLRDETVLPSPPEIKAEVRPAPAKEPVPIPPPPDVAHDTPSPKPPPTKPEPAPRAVVAPSPPPIMPEPSAMPPPPPPKPAQVAKVKSKAKTVDESMPKEKPAPPDPLASLLKSVMEKSARHAVKTEQKRAQARPIETPIMAGIADAPPSSSVLDAIRRQVEENWTVPAGAIDAGGLAVAIHISLLPDGTVQRATIVDQARLSQAFYRTMAESARRAVLQASPLRDLPPEKYKQWREITFIFKPPV